MYTINHDYIGTLLLIVKYTPPLLNHHKPLNNGNLLINFLKYTFYLQYILRKYLPSGEINRDMGENDKFYIKIWFYTGLTRQFIWYHLRYSAFSLKYIFYILIKSLKEIDFIDIKMPWIYYLSTFLEDNEWPLSWPF